MVQWCFAEQGGARGSVFEMFSGRGRNQREALSPSRHCDGISPTRVHAVESARQQHASTPIYSGRCGGEVRRAIASLPSLDQAWVHHCYNPSLGRKAECGAVLMRLIGDDFREQNSMKGVHRRTRSVIDAMLRKQVREATSYWRFCQWSEKMPESFGKVMTRDQWKKTYRAYWKLCRVYLIRLDRSAMRGVAYRTGKKSA